MKNTNDMLLLMSKLERLAYKKGIEYTAVRKGPRKVSIKIKHHTWVVSIQWLLERIK